MNEEAKERLLMTGLIVNIVLLELTPLQDPPAFVSVKMPFEMADNVIILRIADNGQVAKITRRTYSFARHVETGVRVYKVQNPRGYFPERIIQERYNLRLHVRYAGQPPTRYRCGSTTHMIKDCQQNNDKNLEGQSNENHDHDLDKNQKRRNAARKQRRRECGRTEMSTHQQ